jgi:hypothetical protein
MEKVVGDFSTLVKLSVDEAKNICRMGQGEKCCAFLVLGKEGFNCIRMDYPTNMSIFTRLEEGKINAKGEGGWKDCAWEGECK